MTAQFTRADLDRRDAADPLRVFRDAFQLPENVIYLDGNSLGPLPKAAQTRLQDVVETEWGADLITSWNKHGWIDMPQRIGAKIAGLIGAAPHEVIAADSTSINLFKLLAAALRLRPDRRVIVTEETNFPTDLYIAQGLARHLGGDVELRMVARDKILDALDVDTAVVSLTHVDYRTGAMHDMADMTAQVQAEGALMLWDLSHSAGAVPVDLNDCGADLAVGCGYKYLNGGPGAPAYLFVADKHLAAFEQPLSGWMGHAAPFAFDPDYRPADGIAQALCGTPSILALAALECGVDLALKADPALIRRKSMHMGELFVALVEERCGEHGFALASPEVPEHRGSQICFRHPEGYAIMQALIARGVIGDFRAPDILRFGFAPLYLCYTDLWGAVDVLRDVMESGAWDDPAYRTKATVT